MSSIDRGFLVAAALATLTGCASREVGDEVFRPDFGEGVRGNVQAHVTGMSPALIGLSRDFRRSAPDMITFAFNSAVLSPEAQRVLDQQAAWIVRHPHVRLRIYGHTDLVGSDAYNYQLGLRRAQAAAAYLVARGIEAGRLEAVVSFGEARPLVPTNDPARINRRTVTEVIGYVQPAAGLDFDGKRAHVVYQDYVTGDIAEPVIPEGATGIFIAK